MKISKFSSFKKRTFKVVELYLLLLFIQIVQVKGQSVYTWNNVAIGGGGFVSGVITNKTERNLIYARTDVGGAYRWDAVNSKWIPLLDWVSESETGYLGVESIATDPKDTKNVYLLVGISYFNGGKTAILRSNDYGNTFSITDVTTKFKANGNGLGRQSGEKLLVDPNSNNILFCGTRSNGLFKSTDFGATWNVVNSLGVTTTTNGNGISFVLADPSTGSSGTATQTLIAGVSRTGSSNLYRSDDGGVSFSAVTGGPTLLVPHRAVLASDKNLYITYVNAAGPYDISGAGQIWKYNLQTSVWTNVSPTFSGAFGGISVDPNNPSRLVASSLNSYVIQSNNSYGDRIFLSTNGGTTWVDVIARGFTLDANGITWINGNAIHWAGCVEFDPFDTKKAWVISGNGIFSTDDIDATTNVWKFNVRGMEETVPLDIVSIANGPLLSAIGDYDGFRHTTDVTQYAPIHTPTMGTTSGLAVAVQNPNIALRVGSKMYYSINMGTTWTLCTAKGTQGKVAISADGNIFLHCPQGSSTTYKSTDKGTSWTAVSGLSFSDVVPVADPQNPTKFYAYNSSAGTMYVSNDGGSSFSAKGSPGTNGSKIIRAVPGSEGDLWIALYGGGLTRSTNSGDTFSKITNVSYCGAVGFGRAAPEKTYPTIYIWGTVNSVLGVYCSIDQGITWVRMNDDQHEYGGPGNGQFVMGDMNIYSRVYMSTAGRGIAYGETGVRAQSVMVSGENNVATIDTNGGTLQMVATFNPSNTTDQSMIWSITDNTNLATISSTGLLTAVANGTVTVRGKANDGSGVFGEVVITITNQVVTALEEPMDTKFEIYPNPVKSNIIIGHAEEVKHVNLLDMTGEVICSFDNESDKIDLDLSSLPAGIYLMKLSDKHNHGYTKKIVKY